MSIARLMQMGAAGAGRSVPIEYVGYKFSRFNPTSSSATTSLSLTGALSGGISGTIQEDDLVIVSYVVGTNDSQQFTLSFNTSGYTTLFNVFANNTASGSALSNQHFAGYKVMGASPDTSVVINQFNSQQTIYPSLVSAHVYRFVDTSNPIDASVGTQTTLNNTTPSFSTASVTTVTKNALVLGFATYSMEQNNTNMSWVGSFGPVVFSENSRVGISTGLAVGDNFILSPTSVTPATAVSSPQYTSSVDPFKNPSSTAATVALRPATP